MGKVYSSLYKRAGNVMPYLVVVKVGKPTVRSHPIMVNETLKCFSCISWTRFVVSLTLLASLTYADWPGSFQLPDEFARAGDVPPDQRYWCQPGFLRVLQVVTVIRLWTRSPLIASSPRTSVSFVDIFVGLSYHTRMIHDKKLLGVYGETGLANAKQSLMQVSLKFLVLPSSLLTSSLKVYKYFISYTWQTGSRVFVNPSRVRPVASGPFIVVGCLSPISRYSSPTSLSTTTRRIVSTHCIWKTFCISIPYHVAPQALPALQNPVHPGSWRLEGFAVSMSEPLDQLDSS